MGCYWYNPLEKTDSPLASEYHLQITSWFGVGTHIYSLSLLGLCLVWTCADLVQYSGAHIGVCLQSLSRTLFMDGGGWWNNDNQSQDPLALFSTLHSLISFIHNKYLYYLSNRQEDCFPIAVKELCVVLFCLPSYSWEYEIHAQIFHIARLRAKDSNLQSLSCVEYWRWLSDERILRVSATGYKCCCKRR